MDKNDPNINKIVFSDYLIQKKIGKGSFGTVYSGIIISTNQKIAFKLEKRKGDFPGMLETEACRLYLLQGEGIPKIICYGNNRTDNILIQELLGNSLEELFNNYGKKFSLKTVCNIGIQLMKRIRHIHKKYHIHRDIKPDNFMTGFYKSDNKIYLIDYGLSKKYYSISKKQHIKFKCGKSLVGTARYCSRNAHKGFELSRRDDIESIGYCLIYFLKGILPWQGLKVKKIEDQFNKIAEKKCQTSFEELTKDSPKEFLQYFKYCDELLFEDEPDYEYLISLFKKIINKYCSDCNYEYDWRKKIYAINHNSLMIQKNNNSRNVSLLVNDNNFSNNNISNNLSNNISAFNSKDEEKEKEDKNEENENKISNIIISKEIVDKENENENNENIVNDKKEKDDNEQNKEEIKDNDNDNIIEIEKDVKEEKEEIKENNEKNKVEIKDNNKENKEEVKDNENIIEIEKDVKEEKENGKHNKLRKEKNNDFLPPKKIEDFFSEGNFTEEMDDANSKEKETNNSNINYDNNSDNNIKIDDNNNVKDNKINENNNNTENNSNIDNNKLETKVEIKQQNELNKMIQNKSKDSSIINNFNINININNCTQNKNKNDKNINNNQNYNNENDKNKNENVTYEYEKGIIEGKTRNRNKKEERNKNDENKKDEGIKCTCILI